MPSPLEAHYWQQLADAGLPFPDKSNWDFRYADGENHKHKMQVDFAWTSERVIVEIQGGTHAYGVHNDPHGYKADRDKVMEAQCRGWLVLEFTVEHVRNGAAVEWTRRALDRHKATG